MTSYLTDRLEEAAAAVAFLGTLSRHDQADEIPEAVLDRLHEMMQEFSDRWPHNPGKSFTVDVECCEGLEKPYTYVVNAVDAPAAIEQVRKIHDDVTDAIFSCKPGVPTEIGSRWNDCRRKDIMLWRGP